MKRLALWSGLVLVAVVAASFYFWRESQPRIIEQVELGARDTVLNPERIEAFRIQSHRATKEGGEERIRPPLRTSGPVILSKVQSSDIVRAMNAPGARNLGAKACVPHPGIELVFSRGSQAVSAELCFGCSDIGFLGPKQERLGASDFGHVKPLLVRTVKSIFPSDPAVQALEEEHGGHRDLEFSPAASRASSRKEGENK